MFGDDFAAGQFSCQPQTRCVTVTPLWLLSGYLYEGVTLVHVVVICLQSGKVNDESSSQLDYQLCYLHLQYGIPLISKPKLLFRRK